jgi:hypothetical protein
MPGMETYPGLIEQLDDFDAGSRREALLALQEAHGEAFTPVGSNVNMHFHSFFSYNAEGWSPSRIAWEARRAGLYAAGLCDFDVLDGLNEFLDAGRILGLRATVNVETRACLADFAGVDISSPGEPGVTYIMGGGFYQLPEAGSLQAEGLEGYRAGARERNEALVDRVNLRLPEIAIDYEADVLPLTPAGGATERHIISAYINKAISTFGHPKTAVDFWGRVLGLDFEDTLELMADRPALEEKVRARLVKQGGLGYAPPSPESFPTVDTFVKWVCSCGAVPMVAWLDGTSGGESDPRALLECMRGKGCAALNIIPDRNWNVKDKVDRAVKTANLRAVIDVAEDLAMPINVGTEMNKLGLPFVDDLAGEQLAPYKDVFLRGARIMVGHTRLARYAGMPYGGVRAVEAFPDVSARNDFFENVGALAPLTEAEVAEYAALGPEAAFSRIVGCVEHRCAGPR